MIQKRCNGIVQAEWTEDNVIRDRRAIPARWWFPAIRNDDRGPFAQHRTLQHVFEMSALVFGREHVTGVVKHHNRALPLEACRQELVDHEIMSIGIC